MHRMLILLLLPASLAWASPDRISVLTYNLENLFDTEDAPDRQDETFLPLAAKQTAKHRNGCGKLEYKSWQKKCLKINWDERALAGKIRALAQVIRRAGNPDIVVLQEVENIAVLHRLADALSASGGYPLRVLIEGDDRRGIDQAVLTRLAAAGKPRLHRSKTLPARGVLQVPVYLPGGERLDVFAVHLAAPHHPSAQRLSALRTLRRITSTGGLNLLAGDFNLSPEDSNLKAIAAELQHWSQAQNHCRMLCAGTYYYGAGRRWNWLDRVLLSPNMAPNGSACWRLDANSVHIVRDAPEQITPGGYPRSYSLYSGRGASDHLPLLMELHRQC